MLELAMGQPMKPSPIGHTRMYVATALYTTPIPLIHVMGNTIRWACRYFLTASMRDMGIRLTVMQRRKRAACVATRGSCFRPKRMGSMFHHNIAMGMHIVIAIRAARCAMRPTRWKLPAPYACDASVSVANKTPMIRELPEANDEGCVARGEPSRRCGERVPRGCERGRCRDAVWRCCNGLSLLRSWRFPGSVLTLWLGMRCVGEGIRPSREGL